MNNRRRAHCFFYGTVQGVCFRYNTQSLSHKFAVTGFVCNVTDGSVEMVAEGEREEVERFIAAIKEKMDSHILKCRTEWSEYEGVFSGFEIAR